METNFIIDKSFINGKLFGAVEATFGHYRRTRKCRGFSSVLGSLPEWQEFFASGAKPPDRFRDCATAPLMTDDGWEGEWRLYADSANVIASSR